MGIQETDTLAQLSLPPGFRFYPTDEELLVQYLCRKVAGHHFALQIIAEIDLYKFDPWVLPSKAIFGEKEWYFFSPRDRKYPNGSRPNRVAGSGYWKATGTDKVITTEGRKIGIKKALVFYVGKAPKGTKTNWIMHEYRLMESPRKSGSSKLDDWVLCRIYKKNASAQKPLVLSTSVSSKEHSHNGSSSSSSSQLDDMLETLPQIEERCFALPRMNSLKPALQSVGDEKNMGFGNGLQGAGGNFDWASMAGTLSPVPELVPSRQSQTQSHGLPSYGTSDVYVPSIPQLCQMESSTNKVGNSVEEEVQSGLRTQQRVEYPGFYQQNSGVLTQNYSVSNTLDPYGFKYPSHPGGFGFRQ